MKINSRIFKGFLAVISIVALSGILLSCTSEGTPDEALISLILAWNSDEDLGSAGTDDDIFFSTSTDGGETWSATDVLNSSATADGNFEDDRFASQMTDGNGVWVVVWESDADIAGADPDMDIFFSRSTDDGETWSDVGFLKTSAATDVVEDTQPRIFTDGEGVWIVVWENEDDSQYDISFSRSTDNGVSWSAPQRLHTNAGQNEPDRQARVIPVGGGNWIAIWKSAENLGGSIGPDIDIFFSRSTDNGQNWSAAQSLNSTAATDGNAADHQPDLITDGSGNVVAVWFSNYDTGGANGDFDIFFSRSQDNGVTWSDAAILNSNFTNNSWDWKPKVMTDGKGTWITVWHSQDNYQDAGTDEDILFSRSTDNGQNWSTAQHLNTNAATDSGDDIRPSIAYLGQDIWIAVWESDENLNGAGTDDDIFFSRSTDGGVTWSAPQLLNDNGTTDSGRDQFGEEPS